MLAGTHAHTSIGMSTIKKRRQALPVSCHPGDYVPFYFCPRSIMLYLMYRGNHPDLTYHNGQESIVHLEADLHAVVAWADAHKRRWAFRLSNAGKNYADFRYGLDRLDEIDWKAVEATDFRDPAIKDGKQAEFLLHGSFPWHLVARIGVISPVIQNRVLTALGNAKHRPDISIERQWYC